MKTSSTLETTDKRLTLGDLRRWLITLHDQPNNAPLRARINLGGTLRTITCTTPDDTEKSENYG